MAKKGLFLLYLGEGIYAIYLYIIYCVDFNQLEGNMECTSNIIFRLKIIINRRILKTGLSRSPSRPLHDSHYNMPSS